ncbi:MAG: aconitate hydratase [Phycisphaerae bacterium]|nr:MAG: aconitate hydratase AcnA [Planctomycetia bacterium]RIK70065.1 MAG: aconitate hydratase AcnA [Planctomycetota bacterium]GJQ26730.1 MAG: aconitate hydratase [Phycisphaerae bacterium]
MAFDAQSARTILKSNSGEWTIASLPNLAAQGFSGLDRLPVSIRILLENALRHCGNGIVEEHHVTGLATWNAAKPEPLELPFMPARVVLQDFTGVPAIVDLAAMRAAVVRLGGDPKKINPLVPVDLVIDHSVQVDSFASSESLGINEDIEFARNRERYEFLRWGQKAFANFRVVPPATGIVHQVNLEYLAKVVLPRDVNGKKWAVPDTLVGTDSHTTMINGLGVLGWGVGGIEAEAVMLGQPIYLLAPEVIGFKLSGRLPEGATATDLVLTVTQMLRQRGVVEKFVEFYGEGLDELSLPDRATIANMAPEYGATMGFFPIDNETLNYLRRTGRTADEVDLVERYAKEQGLFRTKDTPDPTYTDSMYLELSTVEPSLAGPKRPQDRVRLSDVKASFRKALTAPVKDRGFGLEESKLGQTVDVRDNGHSSRIGHGAVVIAAITSCTNTSNPSVMLAAGLLARKAVERGLKVPPHVKTSLAPGSRVVTEYLRSANLEKPLERLGFHTVGYGCTTCIGNSGPLPDPVAKAVTEGNLVAAAVLSGNRNFEGRVNPLVKANYLASPPLVVAYAIAGRADINFETEPLGTDAAGKGVYLRDIWPSIEEIREAVETHVTPEMFAKQYANVFNGNEKWNRIPVSGGDLYEWNPESTYIQEPPFFVDLPREAGTIQPIAGARVLMMVGDSVTTDHISPAGSIKADSPAGKYLQERGVAPKDFNSYGARRGNDRVMTRGTFANIRLRNLLAPGTEGCVTRYLPTGEQMSVYDAAMKYRETHTPLLVIAGAEYGTGSSRDWAAKGTLLLGVRAVLAVSFERIHRSNLVGMGVLPLQFKKGESRESLGLTGEEVFTIEGINNSLRPMQEVTVKAAPANATGATKTFQAVVRIDTPIEIEYYRNGGILPTVLRRLLK